MKGPGIIHSCFAFLAKRRTMEEIPRTFSCPTFPHQRKRFAQSAPARFPGRAEANEERPDIGPSGAGGSRASCRRIAGSHDRKGPRFATSAHIQHNGSTKP